jgi:hypothetical protein
VNGECLSNTASGLPWKPYVNKIFACVPEWSFYTRIIFEGGEELFCADRGGAIKIVNGIPWIDILTDKAPPVRFGDIITVRVIFP